MTTTTAPGTPTSRFVGVCETHSRPVSTVDPAASGRYLYVPCPDGGEPVRLERLRAVISFGQCDARCMNASRDFCECACGGDNHAGRWAATSTTSHETETALAAYRADRDRRDQSAEKRREAAARRKQAAFDRWAEDGNRDIVDFLTGQTTSSGFMSDMSNLITDRKVLTIRQAEAVRRSMGWAQEATDRRAAELAEAVMAKPVPTGKAITIEGVIVHTRYDDNPYGPGGALKMLIKGDCGWKVWSTVPASLCDGIGYAQDQLRNRRVRFVADVQVRGDDETFGIAKRPRQAVPIATVAA